MIELLLVFQFATPVALAAIGETIGQRSGVLNIGLEGSMLVGAYFALVLVLATGSPWLGLLAGTVAGLALTLATAWFSISLGSDQVVTGTGATLFAIGLTGTLYRARFGESGQLISLPELPSWGGVDAVMVFAAIVAIVASWALSGSAWGLALRAAGEFPKAAEASGFSVAALRYTGSTICGTLAGLGGAYLTLGVVGSFAENMTAGRGFVAIAMVTFGRWRPIWVFAACLLIGWLDSLQFALQSKGLDVPFQALIAAPYIGALLVLMLSGKSSLGPAALGRPYLRE